MMSTSALGQMQVRRSGYGAMQLAGPFAFGTPPDGATAIGVLQAAIAAGVDHIDTAQYYGPGVVNDLIREALYPYPDGLAIVSKVAVRRDDGGAVLSFDDPDQLREGIEDNLRSLRLGQLFGPLRGLADPRSGCDREGFCRTPGCSRRSRILRVCMGHRDIVAPSEEGSPPRP